MPPPLRPCRWRAATIFSWRCLRRAPPPTIRRGINEPQNLDNGSRPFINGNREQANQYFLDGILNSEDKNNETSYTPNVDAIQEFNVITQNASAEFGDFEGGVVSVSTKSGTNRFHGSVYEFFRNDALDANLPSNGWTTGVTSLENLPASGQIVPGHSADGTTLKPEFRYNEFGVTFGGPIIKNKLFFFVDYQGLRDLNCGRHWRTASDSEHARRRFRAAVHEFRRGVRRSRITAREALEYHWLDPNNGGANVPFQQILPIHQPPQISNAVFLSNPNCSRSSGKYYPLPQINSVAGGNNYFYNTGSSINTDQGDVRIDYKPSEKDNIFGRWSEEHLRNPVFSGCPLCASGSAQGADQPMTKCRPGLDPHVQCQSVE